jgi:hypothetical protein
MKDDPQITALARNAGNHAALVPASLLGAVGVFTPDTLPRGYDKTRAVFGHLTMLACSC